LIYGKSADYPRKPVNFPEYIYKAFHADIIKTQATDKKMKLQDE